MSSLVYDSDDTDCYRRSETSRTVVAMNTLFIFSCFRKDPDTVIVQIASIWNVVAFQIALPMGELVRSSTRSDKARH